EIFFGPALAAFGLALVLFRFTLGAVDAQSGDGRSDAQEQKEREDESERTCQRRIAPAPAPDTFHASHRTGVDRFVAQETAEFVRQFLRGGETLRRFRFKAF